MKNRADKQTKQTAVKLQTYSKHLQNELYIVPKNPFAIECE